VNKPSAPSLPSAPTPPTAPTLSFTDVRKFLDKVDDGVSSGALVTALGYLTTGEPKINTVSAGDRVGETYGEYGDVAARVAADYVTQALAYMREQEDALTKYASEVSSFGQEVNQYASEVSGLINKFVGETNAEALGTNNVEANVAKYQAEIADDRRKIEKFAAEINNYQIEVSEYDAEVAAYNANVSTIIQRAAQEANQVTNYLNIGGRYLASGQAKINEFLTMLGVKPELQPVMVSSNQPSW
jgi:hypothetical protein